MFVTDVADDLLDQILGGHHARRAAVLVDDHGGLQGVGADLSHQRVAVQAWTALRDRLCDGGDQRELPLVVRHSENLLDVHDSDCLVEVAIDDRES